MSRTRAEVADHVWTYLDIDSEDMSSDLIDQWIRSGFNRIVNERVWTGYETVDSVVTVADTQAYDLSYSENQVAQLFGLSGPLPRYGQSEAEGYFGAGFTTETGEPKAYSIYDEQVYFWPTPNDAYTYTIRVQRVPANPLDGDSSTIPDLPEDELHEVLLDFVMAQANVQQDDYEKAQWFQTTFETTLKELAAADGTSGEYQPIVINGHRTGAYGYPPERHPWPWEI